MKHRAEAGLFALVGLALWACAGARVDAPPLPDAGTTDAADSSNEIASGLEPWLAQPVYTPGSRLHAQVQDGGGDAVAFLGLYDTQLGFACNYVSSEDGARRCLPPSAVSAYLDSACTRPVFLSQPDSAAASCSAVSPEFATQVLHAEPSCAEAFVLRAYRAGAARAPAEVYSMNSGRCEALGKSECLYDAVALPPEAFVRGQVQRRAIDHGLALDEIAYDDGARAIIRIVDVARDASCAPTPEVAGDRCLPLERAHDFGTSFRDATCAGEPVAIDPSHAEPCGVPQIALRWEKDLCGQWQLTPFALGQRLQGAYQLAAHSCSALEPELEGAIYRIGAMLELKSFPALRAEEARGPRLALTYYTSLAGLPLIAARGFTDTRLDRACYVETFSDGSQRCVPRTLSGREPGDVGVYGPFLDSACKTRALAWQRPKAPCVEVPDVARIWPDDSTHVDRVASVGKRLPSINTIYVLSAGACVASPSDPDSDYYALDSTLDLPVITTRVE
jgi:hypothetical protein